MMQNKEKSKEEKSKENLQSKQKNIESVSFNIDDYDIDDLEKLFGLFNNNFKYKKQDIEQNEYSIVYKLTNDLEINNNTKQQLISFYAKAKQKLIALKFIPPSLPSTFQNNGREQLDSTSNNWLPNEPGA